MQETKLNETRSLMASLLKIRRQKLGMSLQELSEKSGMSTRTLERFEEGKFWMNMKQYLTLCILLRYFPLFVQNDIEESADQSTDRINKAIIILTKPS